MASIRMKPIPPLVASCFLPSTSETASKTMTSVSGRELLLTRIINAPRQKVYAAWTQPELFKQWIAPRPCRTPHAAGIESW